MATIAVYGASGYTGRLVVAELAAGGHDVVAAGRDAGRLRATGAGEIRVARLDDPPALARALSGCAAVVSCAGPFLPRGDALVDAAIAAGVPYLDTAAEQAWVHRVFEQHGPRAAAAGVPLLPAAGLDVVPADLACALAADGLGPLRALSVVQAVDAFRMSRGTLRTALAGMAQRPLAYERGGWHAAPRFARPARFAFPAPFGSRAIAPFPTAAVVTAPRHLEADAVRTAVAARAFSLGCEPLAPLAGLVAGPAGALVRGPLARAAHAVVGRLPAGPGEARRRARWIIVAVAHARDGRRRQVAVRGTDVYGTTAATAALAASELAASGGLRGALAPAQALAPAPFLERLGLAGEVT